MTLTSIIQMKEQPLYFCRKPPRRIAGVAAGSRDIPCHYGARTDHHVVDDPHRHDGRIRSDRHPVADRGLAPQLLAAARRTAAGERIVDEHDAVADETVLADRHQ